MRRAPDFAWFGLLAVAVVGCHSAPTAVCGGLAYITTPPRNTAVALGQSIVLVAEEGTECDGDPIRLGSALYWRTADSTIVSIGALDSIHVRIAGKAVGTTAVMTSTSPIVTGTWSTTQVTVR